ncbi:MAG: glycosyltransferase [Alicyclobacillus sp.]|nr:glycosyltransferase [Alicyclobacillus sp.]
MLEALVFWLLATYGAVVLVWQCAARLRRRWQVPRPVTLVLIVRDAEQEIEGTLRTLVAATALAGRDRQIVVVDHASSDDTGVIVRRMLPGNPCLSYRRIEREGECAEVLAETCLGGSTVAWIWDARRPGALHEAAREAVRACR